MVVVYIENKEGYITGIEYESLEDVILYTSTFQDGTFVRSYRSLMEASRIEGIYHQGISLVALGRLKTSGGFIWKYI